MKSTRNMRDGLFVTIELNETISSEVANKMFAAVESIYDLQVDVVPVIYDLDFHGEANVTYFFCSTKCRSNSESKLPGNLSLGTTPRIMVPSGTICENCCFRIKKS